MRTVINKSGAVKAVIGIIACIVILAIFPVRLFTTTKTITGGGTICGSSEIINSGTDVVQRFVAAYDRIDNIEITVTEVGGGRYFQVVLFNEQMQQIYSAYVDIGEDAAPVKVQIPMLVELNVNETYTLVISSALSSFRVAYEDIPAESPYVRETSFHDTGITGIHLAASYNYSVPLAKSTSLGLIGCILLLAVLAICCVGRYYRRRPDKDKLITVHRALRFVLNPVCVIALVTAMCMVFPLEKFTHVTRDIIFYEIGLLIILALALYAINHDGTMAKRGRSIRFLNGWSCIAAVGQTILIALAIKYTCDYMNALYDIYHKLADRPMLICLLGVILLMFPLADLLNIGSIIYLVLAVICGRFYYVSHLMAETEKEYDLNNAVLKYNVIIAVLAGWLILAFLHRLPGFLRERKKSRNKGLSLFGILMILFLVLSVVFRGERPWELALALVYGALFLAYGMQKDRQNWLKIVTAGILLNFICTVLWSMLYRPLAGYVMPRFSLQFHTVTVTAEYLTSIMCVAIVLLLAALYRVPKGSGLKVLAASIWKEFVLFGVAAAYMLLTMSRTIIASIVVAAFVLLIVVERNDKKTTKNDAGQAAGRIYYFGRSVLIMLLSMVLLFPATFTAQRILQTVMSRPYVFEIEDTAIDLRGGAVWDNPSYLSVNRFVNVFCDRVFGIETSKENVPTDRFNYNADGTAIYDIDGQLLDANGEAIPFTDETYLAASQAAAAEREALAEAIAQAEEEARLAQEAAEEAARAEAIAAGEEIEEDTVDADAEDADDSENEEDYSNGRMFIFQAYLSEMNMTGHENMWVTLPSGEELVHAHNTYIQVAYDNGIPVGILFLLVILMALIRGYGYNRKDEQKISALPMGMTLGFAVAALSEWVFHFDNPMTIMLLLTLAPLLARKNTKA